MGEEDAIKNESREENYDIQSLLNFSGASTQQQEPIADGLPLIGFRSTDQNEANISRLLSSQAIPFYMRQERGWGGTERQMLLIVPPDRLQEAIAVLKAGAQAGSLDLAQGQEGLISY